jgi:hypothetical protein
MSNLAAIRAKLAAQEIKSNPQSATSYSGDNAIYPHWNMEEGTTTTVRFLPDADGLNDYFWVERNMINLEFRGIKGQSSNLVTVKVPCVEMFGDNCPILAEVRTFYKDPSLKEIANKYWKKRTYIFQGFVRNSQMTEENQPENPIRRFIISPQIFGVIKNSLMDPDIEEVPTHYLRGLDFRIIKTSKGGYADYSTSGWARKESALTADEQQAIEKFGLFNLKDFLPKKPSESELRVMKEMFDASLNGEEYDTEKWGAYYRPSGVQAPQNTSHVSHDEEESSYVVQSPVATKSVTKQVDEEPVVATDVKVTTQVSEAKQNVTDVLAMIRSKRNAQA